MRRSPLNPMSAKRRKMLAANGIAHPSTTLVTRTATNAKRPNEIGPDAETVDAVVDRDQHSCVVCGQWLEPDGRGSSWSVHHRRRIRTDNRMCNLIAVCGGADVHGCHQEIHANVAKAEKAGWLVKKAFDPADKVMAHSQFGWVLLTPMGNIITASKEEPSEHPF